MRVALRVYVASPLCNGLPATGSQVTRRVRLWRVSHFITQYDIHFLTLLLHSVGLKLTCFVFPIFSAPLSASTRASVVPSAKKASLSQVYSRTIHTNAALQSMRLRMRPELEKTTKNWHVGVEKGSPEFNVRYSSVPCAFLSTWLLQYPVYARDKAVSDDSFLSSRFSCAIAVCIDWSLDLVGLGVSRSVWVRT